MQNYSGSPNYLGNPKWEGTSLNTTDISVIPADGTVTYTCLDNKIRSDVLGGTTATWDLTCNSTTLTLTYPEENPPECVLNTYCTIDSSLNVTGLELIYDIGTNYSNNMKISYTCPNYTDAIHNVSNGTFMTALQRYCLWTGIWEEIDFSNYSCERISCDNATDYSNLSYSMDVVRANANEMVTYTCEGLSKMNHVDANTSFTATCSNATWDYIYPSPIYECVTYTECNSSNLMFPTNTSNDSNGGLYNDTETIGFWCTDPRKSLHSSESGSLVDVGNKSVECLWAGIWEDFDVANFSCIYVACYDSIEYGAENYTRFFDNTSFNSTDPHPIIKFGEVLEYRCPSGTWTEDASASTGFNVTCQNDTLDYNYPSTIYNCVANTTCSLDGLPNITALDWMTDDSDASTVYYNGMFVTYSCTNSKYSLFDSSMNEVHNASLECLWGGAWDLATTNITSFSCRRIACDLPDPPPTDSNYESAHRDDAFEPLNGTAILTEEKVAYMCPPTYRFADDYTSYSTLATCQAFAINDSYIYDAMFHSCKKDNICPNITRDSLAAFGLNFYRDKSSYWLTNKTMWTVRSPDMEHTDADLITWDVNKIHDGQIGIDGEGYLTNTSQMYNWIEIDLGETVNIVEVEVHRTVGSTLFQDYFVNMEVRVGSDKVPTATVDGQLINNTVCESSLPSQPSEATFVSFTCDSIWGRFITIQTLEANGMLAIDEVNVRVRNSKNLVPDAKDCAELFSLGFTASDVFDLDIGRNGTLKRVRCEDSWTIIVERSQNDGPNESKFFLTKSDFESRIGHVSGGEYFIGLRDLAEMTNAGNYELRIWMESDQGVVYADYATFRVHSGPDYVLEVSGFDSNNSFNLLDDFGALNGSSFYGSESSHQCVIDYSIVGWFQFHNSCIYLQASIFGMNYYANGDIYGIFFDSFNGPSHSLKGLKMGIRPTGFQKTDVHVNKDSLLSSISSEEYPQTHDTTLRVFCPPGQKIFDPNGNEYEDLSPKCTWDDPNWTDLNNFNLSEYTCQWVSCPDPPIPPTDSNLMIYNWTGLPTPIGQNVTYKCKDGMKMESDFNLDTVTMQCTINNQWNDDSTWPKCIPSPLCPALEPIPPSPWNGTAELLQSGQFFGPCLPNFIHTMNCPETTAGLFNELVVSSLQYRRDLILTFKNRTSPQAVLITFSIDNPTAINYDGGNLDIITGEYPNQLIISEKAGVTLTDTRSYNITMKYNLPTLDDFFCIYNTECEPSPGTFLEPKTSINATFIPESQEYFYNTKVSYECGVAREFLYPNGTTFPTQEFTCAWDGNWTDSNNLYNCTWVACLEPTSAPDGSNIVPYNWDGLPIAFETDFPYVCFNKMRFEADLFQPNVTAKCTEGNIWVHPNDWGICVDSKQCPPPLTPPFEGLATVTNRGSRFGPVCANESPQKCFGSRIFYDPYNWTQIILNITTDTSGIDDIYLVIQFSAPVQNVEFKFQSSGTQFDTSQRNLNPSTIVVYKNNLDLPPQNYSEIQIIPNFDPEYGNVCIEDIECDTCVSTDCADFKETLDEKWNQETFFDNSTHYLYESEVLYECGPARAFLIDPASNATDDFFSMSCQWNTEWNETQLPDCMWVACEEPPLAPAEKNLEIKSWNGSEIAFGAFIDYECKNGMKFEEDFNKTIESVECLPGNKWGEPEEWPACVETNLCSPPPQPVEGEATVINAGLAFGMSCFDDGIWTNVSHLGCPIIEVKKIAVEEIVSDYKAKYEIQISGLTESSNLMVLLGFSQPVEYGVDVDFTGTHSPENTPTSASNLVLMTFPLPATFPYYVPMEVTWPKEPKGLEPCLTSMFCSPCADSSECLSAEESTFDDILNTHNLTRYGTEITYSCDLGRQFKTSPGVFKENITMSCLWNGNWTPPYTTLPPCEWVACVNPPIPDADSHIVSDYVNDTVVQFNETVFYSCETGYYFEEDYNMTGFELMCLPGGRWEQLPDKRCIHPSENICDAPPPPPSNGGLYDWDPNQQPAFGTKVTYECDIARKLQTFKYIDGNLVEELLDTQTYDCQWDGTWYPNTAPPPCVWIACINPPAKEELNLQLLYDLDHPISVEFGENVTYECLHEGLYFKDNRNRVSFDITCMEGGYFAEPFSWPSCVETVFCIEPPEKPRGGTRIWDLSNSYGTTVEYGCGPYAKFLPPGGGPYDFKESITIHCQWDGTWSKYDLDPCIWSHCNVIPEPPAESGLLYYPEENSTLVLLSEFSAYAPSNPFNLKVPFDYGTGKVLIVDGYINDQVSNLPTFTLVDGNGNVALKLTIDPSYEQLSISTELETIPIAQSNIVADFGDPFLMYVDYQPAKDFQIIYNHEAVPVFSLLQQQTDLVFDSVDVLGDVTINFIGFGEPGSNPATPVGTVVTYGCQEDYVFENNWYRDPIVRMTCQEDGLFDPPTDWPRCIDPYADLTSPDYNGSVLR